MREISPCFLEQVSNQCLLLCLGATHVVRGGSAGIQHRPLVIKVSSGDFLHRLLCPGLVLDAIGPAIPLQTGVPAPSGEVPLGLALAALTGLPPLPVGLQAVLVLRLLLLLEDPC